MSPEPDRSPPPEPAFGRIAVVLLAAGRSHRFGAADKLEQPLDGRPLALHAGATLAALPCRWKFAVCATRHGVVPAGLAALGFDLVVNPDPARGQAASLALGVAAADAAGAEAVLIGLADMPDIGPALLRGIIERWAAAPDQVIAAAGPGYRGPPALFPRAAFPALLALEGDRGARALLEQAVEVEAAASELRDFDLPEDFARPRGPAA